MSEELKQKLIAYASEIGIDKIGFASAEPFSKLHSILLQHRELGYESGFEEKELKKRVNPSLSLADAKSLIAIAIAYPTRISEPPSSTEGNYRGFIARSAWGIDYHVLLRQKLEQLGDFLKRLVPTAEYIFMTDTGVLSDHAVAERAGLGWIGKNSLLLTEEFGSYVYLGELVTNIRFPEDHPLEKQCGECTICFERCPSSAIVRPGQVNAKKCLSYISQRKDKLEDYWQEKLGNRLYGCDTCQIVCPKNKGINFTHQQEAFPAPELAKPLLKPILTLSNKEFITTFGKTAAGWRGKKTLQRNAIIALGHFKDKTALPDLQKLLLYDQRPVIRQTSAWAIGEIGGIIAGEILQMAKINEKDEKTLVEIRKAIEKIENFEAQDVHTACTTVIFE